MYFKNVPIGAFYSDLDGNVWRKLNNEEVQRRATTMSPASTNAILISQSTGVFMTPIGHKGFHLPATSCTLLSAKSELEVRMKIIDFLTKLAGEVGVGETVSPAEAPAVPTPAEIMS